LIYSLQAYTVHTFIIKGFDFYIMFIQTQETPNPQSLMFLPGQDVLGHHEPMCFDKPDACTQSPFARRLLDIDGVLSVFFGTDFITVTKDAATDWYVLKPHILGVIMENYINKLPILLGDGAATGATVESDDPIFHQIREIIETRVRPAVANDGGDIVLHSFTDGIVYLVMKGACSGCPSSSVTLKSGIENMLKFYVPEVLEVRQINE
jgi:Fe-S cluster biogenesis protein NfuA